MRILEWWKTRQRIRAFLKRDPEMVDADELVRREFLAANPDYLGMAEPQAVVSWLNPFTTQDIDEQRGTGRWDWGDINSSFEIRDESGLHGSVAIPYVIVYDLKAHTGSRNEPYAEGVREQGAAQKRLISPPACPVT